MVGSNIGCVPPNSKNNSTKNNAGQTPTLSSPRQRLTIVALVRAVMSA